MPKVDLKQYYRAADGTLYGPGKAVEVSDEFARSIGRGSDAPADSFDAAKASKAELVAEAERRGITVSRADGKDSEPTMDDYREALT